MLVSYAVHTRYSPFLLLKKRRFSRHSSSLLFTILLGFILPYGCAVAVNNVGVIDLSKLEATRVSAKLVGTMDRRYIDESSGLATSAIHDGVLWTLNDSGNGPTIFPITLDGTLFKPLASTGVSIEGAENFDWESMASNHKGVLYIADSGQNLGFARTPIIYQVNEPVDLATTDSVPIIRKIPYHYEDQSGFLMSRNEFDVEAMFYSDETLNLITKGWGNSLSKWYRIQESNEFDSKARLVTRINFGKALITGAEVDRSGLRLAVLAKRSIWLFTREALGGDWFAGKITYLRTRDIGVTEAISFYGNRLYISNEAGQLYTVSLEAID
ncbi:MAG: hypothetical protein COC05_06115 [Gammaproteobacteria bacterium]|nr:MAG: hypothetical protein COC05_06115 [Gammaproteobacteria bacterium]